MPSPTLTPDPPAAAGQPTAPAGPSAPPGQSATAPGPSAAADREFPGEPPVSSELRLITVPAGWPPYDCETHGPACPMARPAPTTKQRAGSHAPEPAGPIGPTEPSPEPIPTEPSPGPIGPTGVPPGLAEPTRLAGPTRLTESVQLTGPSAAYPAASTAGLAPIRPRQFAQVIVEILAGSRPPRQIVPCATDSVRAKVDRLTRLFACDQRPRLQRIMTSRPAVSVVEMTMIVGFGPRSRALALRLEHEPARPAMPGRPARSARWLCTEIEAG